MTSWNLISHVFETRKFVMALLHWKQGLLCDKIRSWITITVIKSLTRKKQNFIQNGWLIRSHEVVGTVSHHFNRRGRIQSLYSLSILMGTHCVSTCEPMTYKLLYMRPEFVSKHGIVHKLSVKFGLLTKWLQALRIKLDRLKLIRKYRTVAKWTVYQMSEWKTVSILKKKIANGKLNLVRSDGSINWKGQKMFEN